MLVFVRIDGGRRWPDVDRGLVLSRVPEWVLSLLDNEVVLFTKNI
jgi:hypothetical protein